MKSFCNCRAKLQIYTSAPPEELYLYRNVEFSKENGLVGVYKFKGTWGGYCIPRNTIAGWVSGWNTDSEGDCYLTCERWYECTKKQVEAKGSYIADVTASASSFPSNGKHTDGNWYVLKNLIEDTLPPIGKSAQSTQEKPYVEEKSISTYEKWTVKDGKKQTILAQVQAPTGSLPKNGLHTDGSWYVLQSH